VKSKSIILFFILSLSVSTKAQNLVSNGYFEIHDTCPVKELSPITPQQITYATGWFASRGTPDYWDTCSIGVPNNTMGYQQDCCSGGGYVGIYTICNQIAPYDDSCREYIGTKLIDTLKAAHKYIASMYVNRSNNWNYSIATMGMLFTDTMIILPNPGDGPLFRATPQIRNSIPLTDTLNWVLIQDTITALGGEAYLTIGNFNTTATSDTIKSAGGFGTWAAFGSAYYYIDGVSVTEIQTTGIKQIIGSNVQVSIYPNPNNGTMMLDYKITSDAKMEITDITGNLVGTYILPTTSTTMQVQNNNLQSGMYLYRIISNNTVVKQGKIVVMK
jgi:hypothetical protein